jgi:chromosome segregation ATPase
LCHEIKQELRKQLDKARAENARLRAQLDAVEKERNTLLEELALERNWRQQEQVAISLFRKRVERVEELTADYERYRKSAERELSDARDAAARALKRVKELERTKKRLGRCANCKANLDAGERCDCPRKEGG